MKKISKWKASYRLLKYGLHAPKLKPEELYQPYAAKHNGLINSTTLDLGCGSTPRNPFGADEFYGVDLFEQNSPQIKVADLAISPIPFESNYFDYITAYDFIEHIPRVLYMPSRSFPFISLMNEIFRCLKPGGYFLSHTPAYPYSPLFRDPTHVNFITEETFSIYFDDVNTYAKIYGFNGGFEIVEQGWNGYTLVTLMKKPLSIV
jgi:SAM-dependent methyltransferase